MWRNLTNISERKKQIVLALFYLTLINAEILKARLFHLSLDKGT